MTAISIATHELCVKVLAMPEIDIGPDIDLGPEIDIGGT